MHKGPSYLIKSCTRIYYSKYTTQRLDDEVSKYTEYLHLVETKTSKAMGQNSAAIKRPLNRMCSSCSSFMPCEKLIMLIHWFYFWSHAVRFHTYMDLRGRRKSMTISPLERSKVTHTQNIGDDKNCKSDALKNQDLVWLRDLSPLDTHEEVIMLADHTDYWGVLWSPLTASSVCFRSVLHSGDSCVSFLGEQSVETFRFSPSVGAPPSGRHGSLQRCLMSCVAEHLAKTGNTGEEQEVMSGALTRPGKGLTRS